jgi:hypothetical protein
MSGIVRVSTVLAALLVAGGVQGALLSGASIAAATAGVRGTQAKPGFVAIEEHGRLWVFREGSEELEKFRQMGELAKHVIMPGVGPGGMTMKAPHKDTILAYLMTVEGFESFEEYPDAVWAFRQGSKELEAYMKQGPPGRFSSRADAGPLGKTVKAPDDATLAAYLSKGGFGARRVRAAAGSHGPYWKPGFVAIEQDGRLWIFKQGSEELAQFRKIGEPAKHVIRPGIGPRGMTVKAPDAQTIQEYMAARPGFEIFVVDGRVWVFRPASESLAQFRTIGEPAKHVIRPGVGPLGMTVKGPDSETVDEYLTAKPGFVTKVVDGRLWVFREGSKELEDFKTIGEPAKHVIRPGAGPHGMTLKAPDTETAMAYMTQQVGFETIVKDGRLWVFLPGSEALDDFERMGEPAKHVIRPGAGPMGLTLKAPDRETAQAYLRACAQF